LLNSGTEIGSTLIPKAKDSVAFSPALPRFLRENLSFIINSVNINAITCAQLLQELS